MNQLTGLLVGVVLLVTAFCFRAGYGKHLWLRNNALSPGGSTKKSATSATKTPTKKAPASSAGASGSAGGGFLDERLVLIFIPALGVFFLMAGLSQLAVLPGGRLALALLIACLVVAIVSFLGMLWGLFAVYYPQSLRPRWLQYHYQETKTAPSRGKFLAPTWYLQDPEFLGQGYTKGKPN